MRQIFGKHFMYEIPLYEIIIRISLYVREGDIENSGEPIWEIPGITMGGRRDTSIHIYVVCVCLYRFDSLVCSAIHSVLAYNFIVDLSIYKRV